MVDGQSIAEDGLLPGAEPWSVVGSTVAVVCMHNLTAHPGVMRGIGERFASAGYTVDVPLLPGHGRRAIDQIPFRFADFRSEMLRAVERVARHADRIALIGSGCGGLCSLSVASDYPAGFPKLMALAVVSTPSGPLDPELVARVEKLVAHGREQTTEEELPGASDVNKPQAHAIPEGGTPARAFLSVAAACAELEVSTITCPILGFYSPSDQTLRNAWKHAERLKATAGGPVEVVKLERSSHIATVDYEAQMIEDRIFEFVDEVMSAMSV